MHEMLCEHLTNIIAKAFGVPLSHRTLMVFDEQSALAKMIAAGYRSILTNLVELPFEKTDPEEIRLMMNALAPGDLVILVQSSSFRLNEFRFRLELFDRHLAVIEHPHLGRMPESEHEIYIDSLAYDPAYYRVVGPKLKEKIDTATQIIVRCDGAELVYDGPFESAKLNIGDYRGMKNAGGQFPIGEVFTEPSDLANVNGTVKLFAYADAGFHVISPEKPVTVRIEKGIIVDVIDPPESFVRVMDQITADEPLWVRELGFGMNRAMTRHRRLTDIGSYERMCGIHLSLGQKHTIYTKAGFPKRASRYHVDVFVDVAVVEVDGEVVYRNGAYCV